MTLNFQIDFTDELLNQAIREYDDWDSDWGSITPEEALSVCLSVIVPGEAIDDLLRFMSEEDKNELVKRFAKAYMLHIKARLYGNLKLPN